MPTPLISIIIPCYNASNYISETIQSIVIQNETNFEIIVVDDGSTDDSRGVIHSISDNRIKYIYQQNKGVSTARNNGLINAKGDYIIFFDSDDIMTSDFLASRVNYLKQNINVDYICGEVQKFDESGLIQGYFRGTGIGLIEEILLYNPEVVTCPSNYLFKTKFLKQNDLTFNINLSSTADKFFLINCSKYGNTNFVESVSKLHYRVCQSSMSHKFTDKLVCDNEIFYDNLLKYELIPKAIQNKSLFLGNFILFASFWKLKKFKNALYYAAKSFFYNPYEFIKKVFINK
jgi:glycosyltransferase involved in cell wall biosynthesis